MRQENPVKAERWVTEDSVDFERTKIMAYSGDSFADALPFEETKDVCALDTTRLLAPKMTYSPPQAHHKHQTNFFSKSQN